MANTDNRVEDCLPSMAKRWNHGKLSLLFCHLYFALDETYDLTCCLDEQSNMLEAELLLHQLEKDLSKLFPNPYEFYTRPAENVEKLRENEENEEEDEVDFPIMNIVDG